MSSLPVIWNLALVKRALKKDSEYFMQFRSTKFKKCAWDVIRPGSLLVLIFLSKLSTPFLETVVLLSILEFLSIVGDGYVVLHGLEKTLENCSLNKLALSLGLEIVLLLSFRSEIPVFSVLWLLT